MSLVVFTGAVGLMLAPGHIHPVQAVIAMLCIAVGSGASGAINMWYERDIDALMRRTRNRPLPAGRMMPGEALGFGITLATAAVLIMVIALNLVAAALLAAAIGFYVFVYTIALKRRTPQNIVIGGAAGAFPPVIGWAAVTGDIGWPALMIFALIFLWTPPHFWSLALYRADDYAKAGVPMLPVVAGPRVTRIQILIYTLLLWPISLAPTLIGMVRLDLRRRCDSARPRLYDARGVADDRAQRPRRARHVRLFAALSFPAVRSLAHRPRPRVSHGEGNGADDG